MANPCPLCGRDINLVGIAHRCVSPPPAHFITPMLEKVALVNRLCKQPKKREDNKGQK